MEKVKEVKEVLITALEKELQVQGDDIRTYLIDSLVDNLMKVSEGKAMDGKSPGTLKDEYELGGGKQ